MKKNTNGDSGTYVSITKDLTFVPSVSKSPREEENTCRVKKKMKKWAKKVSNLVIDKPTDLSYSQSNEPKEFNIKTYHNQIYKN